VVSESRPPEIRRLKPDDWALFRDVRLAALGDAPYAFAPTVEREAGFDQWQWRDRLAGGTWFAAVAGGRGVGMVGGFGARAGTAYRVDLVGLWVRDGARGAGTGGRLVRALLDWARGAGADEVLLWVADDNAGARRFYRRFGFTGTGVRQPGEEQLHLAL
jgi:GNAT superfamily N-acetyltransferase